MYLLSQSIIQILRRFIWERPTFILATANSSKEGYLAELESERRSIRRSMRQANLARWRFNRLVIIDEAEPKTILRAIEKNRHRLVAFQFSGHSERKMLQFPDVEAKSEGTWNITVLLEALRKAPNLKLLVLNSCLSDSPEVLAFQEETQCMLITTNHFLQDQKGSDFTKGFYQSVSQGGAFFTAFQQFSDERKDDFVFSKPQKSQEETGTKEDQNQAQELTYRKPGEIPEGEAAQEDWPWQITPSESQQSSKGNPKKAEWWNLKRSVWLPMVLTVVACLFVSSVALAAIIEGLSASIGDAREENDAVFLVVRPLPISPWADHRGVAMAVNNQVRKAVYSLGLALEIADFHLLYKKIDVRPPAQGSSEAIEVTKEEGEAECELPVETQLELERIAEKFKAGVLLYLQPVYSRTDITLKPYIFMTSGNNISRYIVGCRAFGESLEIRLEAEDQQEKELEKIAASFVHFKLIPRLVALSHLFAASRSIDLYDQEIAPSYNQPLLAESGFVEAHDKLVEALTADYWSERERSISTAGKGLLYRIAGLYLTSFTSSHGSQTINCPIDKGNYFEEMDSLVCARLLFKRVEELGGSQRDQLLFQANMGFAEGKLSLHEENLPLGCERLAQAMSLYTEVYRDPEKATGFRPTTQISNRWRTFLLFWETADGYIEECPQLYTAFSDPNYIDESILQPIQARIEELTAEPGSKEAAKGLSRAYRERALLHHEFFNLLNLSLSHSPREDFIKGQDYLLKIEADLEKSLKQAQKLSDPLSRAERNTLHYLTARNSLLVFAVLTQLEEENEIYYTKGINSLRSISSSKGVGVTCLIGNIFCREEPLPESVVVKIEQSYAFKTKERCLERLENLKDKTAQESAMALLGCF